MNNRVTLKTISLKDLWNVFRGCFLFVIAAAIICTAAMFAYAKITYTPMYSSKGTLYMFPKYEEGTEISQNDWTYNYTIANVVISDTIYVLQSCTVLNQVGEDIGISNGYGSLKGNISISNPEDTRVLEITATASSPETAKQIVDSLCQHGPIEANRVLQYDRIHVYEEGTYSNWAINQVSLMGYIKFGIIAGVLVYLVFLAMFLFDNYIHTEDDIDRYLGLSILGDIPDADAPKKKSKYARYRNDKKRGYRQYYAPSTKHEDGKKE